ncbi:MAG: hypothetical protein HY052_09165, partial [Proteobacteria bacterium]|nr:hypothetical protein [Pseudomonadota bacterium]
MPEKLQVGDKDSDGWIYVGISEEVRKPMFVAPLDAGRMDWYNAMKGAEVLKG